MENTGANNNATGDIRPPRPIHSRKRPLKVTHTKEAAVDSTPVTAGNQNVQNVHLLREEGVFDEGMDEVDRGMVVPEGPH